MNCWSDRPAEPEREPGAGRHRGLPSAVIGVLAKRQLGANTGVRLPAASQAGGSIGGGAVMQQSQQLPQQIKQSIDATMQQARPEPDDK